MTLSPRPLALPLQDSATPDIHTLSLHDALPIFEDAAAWLPDYPGIPLMLTLIIASLLFAEVWRALLGPGPLERMLRALAGFDRPGSRRPGTRARRHT